MNSRRYIGQSAIVTGGGLGMGRAIALRLAGEGARDVEVSIAAVVRDAGALHVLINNAGIMHPDDDMLEHSSDAAWDRTLAVNFHGPFHCCRFSIPHLLASGGDLQAAAAQVQFLVSDDATFVSGATL